MLNPVASMLLTLRRRPRRVHATVIAEGERRRVGRTRGQATRGFTNYLPVLLCACLPAAIACSNSRAAPAFPAGDGARSSAVAEACPVTAWARPAIVRTPDGELIHLERPTILRTTAGAILLGADGFAIREASLVPATRDTLTDWRAILGVTLEAGRVVRMIPRPPGVTHLVRPRAILGSDGALDVLWTAPVPPDSNDLTSARTLIAARYANGRWSAPDTLLGAAPVLWRETDASNFVRTDTDAAMVVGYTVAGRDSALWLTRGHDGWIVDVHRAEQLIYPRLAVLNDSGALLAYVAPGHAEGNTLFARRLGGTMRAWRDATRPWGEIVQVSPPGRGEVHWPQLVASPDGTLHLAWAHFRRTGSRVLRAAVSVDDGRSWRVGAELDAGMPFAGLEAAVDGSGRLHVVARVEDPDRRRPLHAVWDGDRWTMSEFETDGNAISVPTIGRASDGLIAAWTEDTRTMDGYSLPLLKLSRGYCAQH